MSRRGWVILVVAIVVVAAILSVVLLVDRGVTVPDVTGRTQPQAEKALVAGGLELGDVTKVADQDVPAGSVVKQDPAAGAKADRGSKVALALSTGPGTAAVPNVTGMDVTAAQDAVRAAGFTPQTAYEYDLKAPASQVMAQLPAP